VQVAMRSSRIFTAVVVLVFVIAALSVASAALTVTFSTIASGTQSGVRSRTEVVIRTLPDWQALWRKHATALPGAPAAPKVDFSRDMVIAVFAGEATPATRVSIVRIFQDQGRLIVLVRIGEIQPGPAQTDSAGAKPFQVVRLARSTLPVIFRPARTPATY